MKSFLFFLFYLAVLAIHAQSLAKGYFTSFVLCSGRIEAWGYNEYGQLGNGTLAKSPIPLAVKGLEHVKAVSAADVHALALTEDSTVWAWGMNYRGQLGTDSVMSSALPLKVLGLNKVIAISSDGFFSLALRSDGTVWSWGSNDSGELGQGNLDNSSHPVPGKVLGLTHIKAIAAGYSHGLALKDDGTVWQWGVSENLSSDTAQKINGLKDVIQIGAGLYYSVALLNDSTIRCWGRNDAGQLGDGSFKTTYSPVVVSGLSGVVKISAGIDHCEALKKDGTVWRWGHDHVKRSSNPVPVQFAGLNSIVDIGAGQGSSLAKDNKGNIFGWGLGVSAQFADTMSHYSTPTLISHVCLSNSVGLRDYTKKEPRHIYPNPSDGIFYIRVPQVSGVIYVSIHNLIGELVYSEQVNTNFSRINLQNMPAGIYNCTLQNTHGAVSTQKLVIE